MIDLENMELPHLARLKDDQLRALAGEIITLTKEDRKLRQLLWYKPVSERSMDFHNSKAKLIGLFGGNGSSKTESAIVDMITLATGVYPESLIHLKDEFRGPINCRIVVESLTNVLEPIILPKLMYFKWTGIDMPGGERGHWGWVPRDCLIDGSWEKSYSNKLRTLTILCRNPDNHKEVLGNSTIQFMSHDNDPSDFASGDFHYVILDEPPKRAIFVENQARVMRVDGKIVLAMTWPDDPAIPVDWIYDEIYDKAKTDDTVECFELKTTENFTLDQKAIRSQMSKWDAATISVRIEGQSIRFSNRIHPLFTNTDSVWSFKAGRAVYLDEEGKCPITDSTDVVVFNHVKDMEINPAWPVVQILDPHPRKPHMWSYVVVMPSDDYFIIAEGQCDDTPSTIRDVMHEQEEDLRLNVKLRLIDPNMGQSPSSAKERRKTWREEFREVGLIYELADDSSVGRSKVNEFLKPDEATREPRLMVHPSCKMLISQMLRYSWDEYKMSVERDLKQKPRDKNDDYPAMLKYFMNYQPTFTFLINGAPVFKKAGRRGGY